MASHFRFNTKQSSDLSACWKRPKEREIAALYLRDVEGLVARWLGENTSDQSTSIKDQIALARDLRINVVNSPNLLENLPQDFEGLLATAWLFHKYGEAYFQQHSEACRKDAANNTARQIMAAAAAQALSPTGSKKAPSIKTEFSKLPPNYFQQIKTDADFLKSVAGVASEIEWLLKRSTAWRDKSDDEKKLMLMLIFSYENHFGKLPSAANEGRDGYLSPFRRFLGLFSEIITEQALREYKLCARITLREYRFGARITRDLLATIKEMRASVDLP